jgi:hypothetical protein
MWVVQQTPRADDAPLILRLMAHQWRTDDVGKRHHHRTIPRRSV